MQDESVTDTLPDTTAEDTSNSAPTEAGAENPNDSNADSGEDGPSAASVAIASMGLTRMSLQELKEKPAADLVAFAEALEIENANSMLKQDMMFAILKAVAEEGLDISGSGTLEVLQDGFGFLRSPEANYLAGPDDIYVSPSGASAPRGRASATSPWSRSTRSISRARTTSATRSPSTTSRRSIPKSG